MSPIRVNFYVLTNGKPDAYMYTACYLLEKAYLAEKYAYVYFTNKEEALKLDELLWSFKAESFIPHILDEESHTSKTPILIGYKHSIDNFKDFKDFKARILFNLSPEFPVFYPSFSEVVEIVRNEEICKEISREHYRKYKQDECDLHSQSIDSSIQDINA